MQPTNLIVALDVREAQVRADVLALLKSCAVTVCELDPSEVVRDLKLLSRQKNHHAIYLTDAIDDIALATVSAIGFRKLDKVLLVHESTKEQAQDNTHLTDFNHVLSSVPEAISHTLILSTVRKIREKDYYGVDKCVAFGAHVHRFTLSNSEQRKWFREQLHTFVEGLQSIIGRPTGVFSQFATEVQDELLMNAIWDANPRRRDLERRGPAALEPHEHVHVEWSFDGTSLAVGVRDPFGSFEPSVIHKYLRFLFTKDKRKQVKMQQDGNGAGIGLYMVLERLSSLIITVEPGQCTEVIATLNLSQNPRMLAKSQRSFQYFSV